MQSQCAIKPNRNTLLTNYLQLLFPMSDQTVLATLSMVAFSVVVIHGRDCNHAQQIQGKVETGPTAPYRILGSQYPPGGQTVYINSLLPGLVRSAATKVLPWIMLC